MPRPARVSRGELTRREILDAAIEHFARHGFAGARVDAIAHDVNLVGPAVLYHFGDKRRLYVAALERTFAGLLDDMERALFGPGSLSERIERAISTWVSFVGARPAVARILLREGAGDSPGLAEDLAPLAARVLAMLDRIYEEGRRKRAFRSTPLDPLHVVSATLGATVFFVAAIPALFPRAKLEPLAPEQLEAHRRELLTIVRRLLGIRAPRAVGSRRAL